MHNSNNKERANTSIRAVAADFTREPLRAISERNFDMQGQGGSMTRPRCWATWVEGPWAKGSGKMRKSTRSCQEASNASAGAFTVKVLPFSRATDRNPYRRAETKEPINQFPAVLFSQ
jgi:hypothetical protein